MTLLAGCASFFIGNAYNAQLPGFAENLGHGDPGLAYSMLLAADAAGGLLAGVVLESMALLKPAPRTAIVLALDRSKERGPCSRGMALARRAGAWVDIHDRQVIGDQRRWISR